ncbi:MAG: hypothetical protein M3010_01105, partial [Candidatus Dormibacteraeota bacterium]|nr:hypothetical protein [Candidatus Dormibacteraeota bacterium]
MRDEAADSASSAHAPEPLEGPWPAMPSGEVTFLLTDIEGSTRMLERMGRAYEEVLALHDRVIRAAAERHGGLELNNAGDSFALAFASPEL